MVCGRKEGSWFVVGRWFVARGRKLICGTRKEVGLWHEEGSWFVVGRKEVGLW